MKHGCDICKYGCSVNALVVIGEDVYFDPNSTSYFCHHADMPKRKDGYLRSVGKHRVVHHLCPLKR